MLLFFYGPDAFVPREKVRALTERFLAKNPSGAGLSQSDCADGARLCDVRDALFATSLFTQRRLIVIKNPFALPAADQRELAQKLGDIAPQDVVVFWEQGKVLKTTVLFKKLCAVAGTVKEFTVPQGQAYVRWIARHLNDIAPGTTLTRTAAAELIARIGDDLSQMHNVLVQCAAYTRTGRVTNEIVRLFTVPRAEANAFRAVGALTSGNRKVALHLFREQCVAGEDMFKLFGLYAYHVRSLLVIADCVERGVQDAGSIAQQTGLKSFVITKGLRAVREAVTRVQLLQMHALLTQYDRDIKNGHVAPEDALTEFIVRA